MGRLKEPSQVDDSVRSLEVRPQIVRRDVGLDPLALGGPLMSLRAAAGDRDDRRDPLVDLETIEQPAPNVAGGADDGDA
jgi:hypothetical protein